MCWETDHSLNTTHITTTLVHTVCYVVYIHEIFQLILQSDKNGLCNCFLYTAIHPEGQCPLLGNTSGSKPKTKGYPIQENTKAKHAHVSILHTTQTDKYRLHKLFHYTFYLIIFYIITLRRLIIPVKSSNFSVTFYSFFGIIIIIKTVTVTLCPLF